MLYYTSGKQCNTNNEYTRKFFKGVNFNIKPNYHLCNIVQYGGDKEQNKVIKDALKLAFGVDETTEDKDYKENFNIYLKWNKYNYDDEIFLSQIYESMSAYKTNAKSELTDNIGPIGYLTAKVNPKTLFSDLRSIKSLPECIIQVHANPLKREAVSDRKYNIQKEKKLSSSMMTKGKTVISSAKRKYITHLCEKNIFSYRNIVLKLHFKGSDFYANKSAYNEIVEKLDSIFYGVPMANIIHYTGNSIEFWFCIEELNKKVLGFLYERVVAKMVHDLNNRFNELFSDRNYEFILSESLDNTQLYVLFGTFNKYRGYEEELNIHVSKRWSIDDLKNGYNVPYYIKKRSSNTRSSIVVRAEKNLNVISQMAKQHDVDNNMYIKVNIFQFLHLLCEMKLAYYTAICTNDINSEVQHDAYAYMRKYFIENLDPDEMMIIFNNVLKNRVSLKDANYKKKIYLMKRNYKDDLIDQILLRLRDLKTVSVSSFIEDDLFLYHINAINICNAMNEDKRMNKDERMNEAKRMTERFMKNTFSEQLSNDELKNIFYIANKDYSKMSYENIIKKLRMTSEDCKKYNYFSTKSPSYKKYSSYELRKIKSHKKKEERDQNIINEFKRTGSLKEVQEKYGVDPKTIRKVLQKANVNKEEIANAKLKYRDRLVCSNYYRNYDITKASKAGKCSYKTAKKVIEKYHQLEVEMNKCTQGLDKDIIKVRNGYPKLDTELYHKIEEMLKKRGYKYEDINIVIAPWKPFNSWTIWDKI